MTGSDDGGYKPHPGDPWHPGWRSDADAIDLTPEEVEPESIDTAGPKPKGRRRDRRDRKKGRTAEESIVAPTVETFDTPVDSLPSTTAAPATAPHPGGVEDPFDAVLRAEGRSVRRGKRADSDGPVPAWMVDGEEQEEPLVVAPVAGTPPVVESTPLPGLFDTPDAGPVDDEPTTVLPPQPASDETQIVGEYGVAGSDAFAVLQDTAEQDLDEWEAFMEGTGAAGVVQPPPPTIPEFATPAEPVAGPQEFDEWLESEPEPKRRWFGRRSRKDVAADAAWGEESADIWADDARLADTPAVVDETVYMPPVAPTGWMAVEPEVALEPEPLGDEGALELDPADDDAAAALASALAALGVPMDDDPPRDTPVAGELIETAWVAEDMAADPELGALAVPGTGWSQAEPFGPEAADAAAVEMADAHPIEEMDGIAASDLTVWPDGEPVGSAPGHGSDLEAVEEATDWVGDPAVASEEWFAEVDEDTVIPPPVADTPETEWPVADDRWEGRAAWESEPDTEVFDVEAALRDAELAVEPALEAVPIVPEGYEMWGDAVAEVTADLGDDTAEYPVHPDPVASGAIPVGFEPFPGSEVYSGQDGAIGSGYDDGEGQWMGDTSDRPGAPDTAEDSPYQPYADPDDEAQFDESIYTTGGTMEHRGLAESIAAAGEDDTEWQAMTAAMPGMGTGVLGFDDIADLASAGDEYVAPVRSNLAVRVGTGLALLGLLAGTVYVGGWAFALFVAAIALLGLGEFFGTLRRQGYLPLGLFGLAGGAGTLAAAWFHGPIAIPAGILLTSVATFFFYAFAPTHRDALTNGGLTVLGVAWAIGSIAFALPIARTADFGSLIFAVVAITAAMDIGAYSFGRTWGKRPLAPYLSPNKTLEGLLGGILLVMVAAGALGYLEVGPFDLPSALSLGVVVVIMAPLGDLAESMLKRSIGVKDMGSTLPGHGGVLDRIDALLFVIPAAWALFEILGFLG